MSELDQIPLHVNGEPFRVKIGTTVLQLITLMALENKRIAVEVNEEIVPRSKHSDVVLRQGDCVEVVAAIGGG